MIDAEQEHYDHELGMMTDAQNAFALSQMNRKPDDTEKIEKLVASGFFVVAHLVEEYCPSTDATMGVSRSIHSTHETREAAVVEIEGLDDACIYPIPVRKSEPVDNFDIPF